MRERERERENERKNIRTAHAHWIQGVGLTLYAKRKRESLTKMRESRIADLIKSSKTSQPCSSAESNSTKPSKRKRAHVTKDNKPSVNWGDDDFSSEEAQSEKKKKENSEAAREKIQAASTVTDLIVPLATRSEISAAASSKSHRSLRRALAVQLQENRKPASISTRAETIIPNYRLSLVKIIAIYYLAVKQVNDICSVVDDYEFHQHQSQLGLKRLYRTIVNHSLRS